MVRGRSSPERDVRADHADEGASANPRELPELIGAGPGRERIAVGFDASPADDYDGVRTELGKGVMLGGIPEGDEPQVDAFRAGDTKIGSLGTTGLITSSASKLVLGFDPASAAAEQVGPAILAIGDQRATPDDDVLKRADRRKLSVHWLAFREEGQIKTGFHAEEA